MTPKKIIFYTRVPQVHLHLEMARQLRAIYPDVPIVFATFFEWAAKQVRQTPFDLVYMPKLLREVDVTNAEARCLEIEQDSQQAFGHGLQLMLQSERFLPESRDEVQDFFRRHVCVLDSLVTEGTLSISSMYDHFVYWLGGSLANLRGGAHFAFVACGIPEQSVLALKTPWEAWEGPARNDLPAEIDYVRGRLKVPPSERMEYMATNPNPPVYRRWPQRRQLAQAMAVDRRAGSYFVGPNLSSSVLRRLFRGSRGPSKHDGYFDLRETEGLSKIKEPYFYIPLHMEPEATILMYSPWLRDQIEMCRLCSQALPTGFSLLVKENPKMDGKRSGEFYEKLRALPNVKLVHSRFSTFELSNQSKGVVSLAGNACFEAAILGKPAITFGRPPFRRFMNKSDFAGRGGLAMEELAVWFRNVEQANTQIDEAAWKKWVSGTFRASAVQRYQDGYKIVDYSEENAQRFSSYLQSTLSINEPMKRDV